MDKTLFKTAIFFISILIVAIFLMSCSSTTSETISKPMDNVRDGLKSVVIPK